MKQPSLADLPLTGRAGRQGGRFAENACRTAENRFPRTLHFSSSVYTIRYIMEDEEKTHLCLHYEVKRLAAKKKGGNTVALVRRLAEPIARDLGLMLWDVRFVKEGADWFLRIFIDKPEGIGIEDCEAMSRAINGPLDELDPVEQSYCLEVCSPGMNRELTRDEHFAAYLGAPVQVKLIRPDEDGQRVIVGILEDYRDSTMILRMEEGDERSVARKDASSVRLMDDDFGGIEE
ncbi:MAG: ribosome maturation factor RimP [Anaeromassilibacillus sp.]